MEYNQKTNPYSSSSNPFQTGGGGNAFEHYVQTYYLFFLIIEGNVPHINNAHTLTEISFQNKNYKKDFVKFLIKRGKNG